MSSINEGTVKSAVFSVTKKETAVNVGSGGLNILATPVIVTWVEKIAYDMIQENLPDDLTSVGGKFEIKHISPTPVYDQVTITVKLESIQRNSYFFTFEAKDSNSLIALGSHKRAVVNVENFLHSIIRKNES